MKLIKLTSYSDNNPIYININEIGHMYEGKISKMNCKGGGLKIEERELSYTERYDIHKEYITEDKLDLLFEFATNENLDKLGVPTKLIAIKYNDKTIESYES